MTAKSRILCVSAVSLGAIGASCHPIGPPGEPVPHPQNRGYGSPLVPAAPASVANPVPSAPDALNAPSKHQPPASSVPAPVVKSPAVEKPRTPSKPAVPAAAPEKPAPAKSDIPTAQKAPGRPGYVLSPYTGKLILVSGIPSGVIVPDQTCGPSEKKQFRVP